MMPVPMPARAFGTYVHLMHRGTGIHTSDDGPPRRVQCSLPVILVDDDLSTRGRTYKILLS
jgi:hypothetical protein